MRRDKIFKVLFLVVAIMVTMGLTNLGYALNLSKFEVGGLDLSRFEVGGYIRNETSLRLHDPNEFLWSENIFQLDVNTILKPGVAYFYFSGRFYYDAVYDFKQGYGFLRDHDNRRKLREKMAFNHHGSLSEHVRECYLDISTDHFDIRLGKQQIVWGETDLFQMLDIINPIDMRHFNQHPWEEIRIGLWGAKIDYNPTLNTSLQFVLIPDIEPMFLAPYAKGHPYTPLALRVLPPFTMIEHEVAQNGSNLEWGVRWYQNFGSFNYTLNYFRHWSDGPGVYLDLSKFRIDLKYKRVHSIGGSFSWNFTKFLGLRSVVIRFESVLNLKDIGSAINYGKGGLPETVRTDTFNYCLALDKTFWKPRFLWPSGLTCMFHIFQTYILDYEDSKRKRHYLVGQTNAHADEVETIFAAIFTSTYLPGEYLVPTLAVVYKDDGDWEIMPSLAYTIGNNYTVTLAACVLSGPNDTLLGEFQKSSNVSLRIKYGF